MNTCEARGRYEKRWGGAVCFRPDTKSGTVWKLAPHSSAPHLSMNKFNIPQAAGVRNERFLI